MLEALLAGGYSLGGEQSGHVIFPDHATTGDGMLTALVLLDVVQRSGKQLSQLAEAAMTQLPQVLVNIEVGARRADVAALLADDIAEAQSALGDSGRILVRRQRHRAADQGDGRSTDTRAGAVDGGRARREGSSRGHPELGV